MIKYFQKISKEVIALKLIVTDIEDFNFPVSGEYRLISPDEKLTQCMGCFGCWLKTPGKCVIQDGYEMMGAEWGKCDEAIFISRCTYGSLSPFVKNVVDRSLAYVHPDFVIRFGEMHHKRRYDNDIKCSFYFYGDATEAEKKTAGNVMQAFMDNFYGEIKEIKFFKTHEEMEGIEL